MAILENLSFFGRKVPMHYQTEDAECGLACLSMCASYHGYHTSVARLRSKYKVSLKGVHAAYIMRVAAKMGLQCQATTGGLESIESLKLPAILHWNLRHFVVLAKISRNTLVIHDPKVGVQTISFEELGKHWTGPALEVMPSLQFRPVDDRPRMSVRQLMGRTLGLQSALIQAAILALALEAFTVIHPIMMQLVIDDALVTNDKDLLLVIAGGLVFVGLMRTAVLAVRQRVMLHLGADMSLQWLSNVISHMLHLPSKYFERRGMGDTISRLGAVGQIQQTLTSSILSAMLDGVMTVVTLVMMYIYSPKLAAIAVIAVVLYALLRWVRYEKLRSASEGQIQRQARQQTKLMELIRGVRTIKMFNAQDDFKARYMKLSIDTANSGIVVQQLNFNFSLLNTLIIVIEGSVILGVGAYAVMEQTGFSIGMLMAIITYKDQFSTRVTSLVDRFIEFRMLRIPVDRLADIVLEPPENDLVVMGMEQEVMPSIELIDVGFRHGDSEKWILRHVDMKIEAGESVVLIGPSGCGKTTLLNLIMHEIEPTEGQILIGGQPMSQIGLGHFRNMLGVVMQDDKLFSGSLGENISFFSQTHNEARVKECARSAEIAEVIEKMPMAYETVVSDSRAPISGGEKQRLYIARALYKEPKILILDEAINQVDLPTAIKLSTTLAGQKMTRIIVTHNEKLTDLCGRPIFVNLKQWMPKTLIAAPGGAAQILREAAS